MGYRPEQVHESPWAEKKTEHTVESDDVEFECDLSKKQYERRAAKLRTDLLRAQSDAMDADFPILIIVSGTDAAGRSEMIDLLNEWLDARQLHTFAYTMPSEEERERPPFWRYWRDLPPRGRIGIYYSGWHLGVVLQRAEHGMSEDDFRHVLAQANLFEQQLVDDGALIVKLMFHIDKEQLRERLEDWQQDKEKSWRVGEKQWKRFNMFDELQEYHDEDIARTDTKWAPWTLIDGAQPRRRALQAGEAILAALRKRLDAKRGDPRKGNKESKRINAADFAPLEPRLAKVDLSARLSKDQYEKELSKWQGKLNLLGREIFDAKIPVVLVFEGWDAAGKGGAIRRILPAIDARHYRVIPVAAPTEQEHQYHYLWRFWRRLPRGGYLTIFDRSWYGRVLVERIEGFATDEEWSRAYEEINAFENQLVEFGTVVLKFWLEIDPDEQIRRFAHREQTGYKQHKIDEEDYRNREKWPQYVEAAEAMFHLTCTDDARWKIVAANDKRHARIEVLKTLCEILERALELYE